MPIVSNSAPAVVLTCCLSTDGRRWPTIWDPRLEEIQGGRCPWTGQCAECTGTEGPEGPMAAVSGCRTESGMNISRLTIPRYWWFIMKICKCSLLIYKEYEQCESVKRHWSGEGGGGAFVFVCPWFTAKPTNAETGEAAFESSSQI